MTRPVLPVLGVLDGSSVDRVDDLGVQNLVDEVLEERPRDDVGVDAFPEQAFGGKVSYLSDQVDGDTRTVRARIDVENPVRQLRPGMFARVRISDPHQGPEGELERSLVVPEACVQRDGKELIAFVRLSDHRFERREVTVGRKGQGLVEIVAGLHSGEEVVSEGAFLLKSEVSKENLGGGHAH